MTITERHNQLVAQYDNVTADSLLAAYTGWLKILDGKLSDEQYFIARAESFAAYDAIMNRMGGK